MDNKNKTKNRIGITILVICLFFLVTINVYGVGQPTIIALQGKLTNETTGAVIVSANLRVNVTNTDGTTLWNETFTNGVSNGFFDLLLGTNVNNPLNLTFNQDYNVSIYVGDDTVQIGGTHRFRGGQGLINPSNVSAGNFTAPGNFSFGETLFIDKTNDRVGIGTIVPTNKTEIVNGMSPGLNNIVLRLVNNQPANDARVGIMFQPSSVDEGVAIQGLNSGASNGHMAFYSVTGGTLTERMRMTSAGSFGIGTSSPNATLQLAGTDPLINTTDQENITIASDDGSVIIQLG